MIPDKDETESTIVEIKERGLTAQRGFMPKPSTIVEIKERGLTRLPSSIISANLQ